LVDPEGHAHVAASPRVVAYNSAVKLPWWVTLLDAMAVVFALLTLSVVVFGGFRLTIPFGRLSVMDWVRPAVYCAAALALRHGFVRTHPLPMRVAGAVSAWWRDPDTAFVRPIFVSTRLGVLAIGFLAVILIGYPDAAAARWRIYNHVFLDLPARWDTGWYLSIANEGYAFDHRQVDRQQNIAFFPAFPMLMRYLSPLVGRQPLWAGVFISLGAFFAALVYLRRLARDELGDDDQAATVVTLLAAYPFAVFFSTAYTEGLFLLTTVAAVYHFRSGRLWQAAAWGAVAGLTRPNGSFLSVVLGLMAVQPLWSSRHLWPDWPLRLSVGQLAGRLAAASAPGLGMLTYSAYIYLLTGNAFQWVSQNTAWGREYRGLDTVITDRWAYIAVHGLYGYASTQTLDLFYLLAVLFCLGAVWPVYRRFGLPYAAMLVINVLPPIAAGGLLSMGRVTSVLFPAFLWMGSAVPARHRTAWVVAFAALQGFVAAMFFTWREIF